MSFRVGGPGGGNTGSLHNYGAVGVTGDGLYSTSVVVFFEDGLSADQALITMSRSAWNVGDYTKIGGVGDTTQLNLHVYDNAGSATSANSATGILKVGQWQTITVVRESASVLRAYVDGVLVATNTRDVTGRVVGTQTGFGLLGAWTGTDYDWLVAGVKHVAGTAWTADQVAVEAAALTPHPDTPIDTWLDCRQVVNTTGSQPTDKIGSLSLEASGPEVYDHDPRQIPYWRDVARDIGAPFDALAIGAIQPEPTAGGVDVTPAAATLTVTGFAPEIPASVELTPDNATLTVATFAPAVTTHVELTPANETLTVSTFAPTVTTPVELTPANETLTVTGYAPTLTTPVEVSPPAGSFVVTGQVPTIETHVELLPGNGTIAITGQVPTIETSVGVVPDSGTLTLTGFAPTLPVIPTPGSFVITGYPPETTTAVTVTPSFAELTTTQYEPVVQVGQFVEPGVGPEIVVTGMQPTAVTTTPKAVVSCGPWSEPVRLSPCDEWIVTLDGPSADTPDVRVQVNFRST